MTLRRLKLLPATGAAYELGDPSGPIPVIEIDDATGDIYISNSKVGQFQFGGLLVGQNDSASQADTNYQFSTVPIANVGWTQFISNLTLTGDWTNLGISQPAAAAISIYDTHTAGTIHGTAVLEIDNIRPSNQPVTGQIGIQAFIWNKGGGNTTGDLAVYLGGIETDGGVVSGNTYVFYAETPISITATISGENAGVKIDSQAGVATNNYAIHIANQGIASNDWAIKVDGGNSDLGPNTTKVGQLQVTAPSVPATATSPGVAGTISWDANFIYVCVATNSWKRVGIAAW